MIFPQSSDLQEVLFLLMLKSQNLLHVLFNFLHCEISLYEIYPA